LSSALSPNTLSFSYSILGHLRLTQADRATGEQRRTRAREAEILTERAMRAGTAPPPYVLLRQRGRARELLDQTELALKDYSAAVDNASQWRGAVPAAQSLMTAVNVRLQHQVYDSFVEAAAREALRTGSRAWAADAFRALEANRAVSLRENRLLAPVWKKKLPVAYWETLERLSQEEGRSLGGGSTLSPESENLRLRLTEMESLAGLGISPISVENFRSQNSLSHFQHGLSKSDLVLSFYLGKRESYLWAVTQSSLAIYRLPAEDRLRDEVKRFREHVIADEREGDKLGADLYKQLFGSLKPREVAKTTWLLSLDGPLFELPFPALVSGYRNSRPVYLVEGHSSQSIPGALFLTRSHTLLGSAKPGGYLGVGDAVYNSADSRSMQTRGWGMPDASRSGEYQLNRLVSSGQELARSWKIWQTSTATGLGRSIQILEGTEARREDFLQRLNASATQPAPSTIHLATHVLAPPTQPEQAFLAFSIDARGMPGLLSAAEVGMLHVPDALVVMTGCATATGDIRAGAGMLGLTRAWMMAGARAVVATNWPIPDADGDLIPAFYQNVRTLTPAEALRRSQLSVIHSGTWQASPSYWAAFQVTGGGL
jgi:CHAT domain-containing protein